MRTQRSTTRITDALVKALPTPTKGNKIVSDDLVTGFGVRVTPAGVKSFVLRYRNEHGTDRRITIGRCSVWTVAAAREESKRLLRDESDPLAKRQAAREVLMIDEVLDDYVKSARFAEKAESTQAIDRGRLNRHVRPLLGKRFVDELQLDDVQRAFADISKGKTASNVKTKLRGLARVRGGAGTAKKAILLLRAALAWAVSQRKIGSNPAAGVKMKKDGVRKTILDAEGYQSMFAALQKLEAGGQLKTREADAIRVIALTGARRGEIAGLRREHVDQNSGLITLPPSGHKTGKATGDERIIGLPKAAQEIVARQPDGEVVFPVDGPSLTKAWTLVRMEAKLPSGIGLHGLRHSVASHLAMGGAGAAEIMTAMGHRQMSTSQKYIHWINESRGTLAERAASVALAGMQPRPKD